MQWGCMDLLQFVIGYILKVTLLPTLTINGIESLKCLLSTIFSWAPQLKTVPLPQWGRNSRWGWAQRFLKSSIHPTEFIHYSNVAARPCVIVSQGSTRRLLPMTCTCKHCTGFCFSTSEASWICREQHYCCSCCCFFITRCVSRSQVGSKIPDRKSTLELFSRTKWKHNKSLAVGATGWKDVSKVVLHFFWSLVHFDPDFGFDLTASAEEKKKTFPQWKLISAAGLLSIIQFQCSRSSSSETASWCGRGCYRQVLVRSSWTDGCSTLYCQLPQLSSACTTVYECVFWGIHTTLCGCLIWSKF